MNSYNGQLVFSCRIPNSSTKIRVLWHWKLSTEAPPDGCRCFSAFGSLQRGIMGTPSVMSAPAGPSHKQSESFDILAVPLRTRHTALCSLSLFWQMIERENNVNDDFKKPDGSLLDFLKSECVCVCVWCPVHISQAGVWCVFVTSVCRACQCFPGCFSASCWALSSCCWCWPSAASPPSSPASPPSSTSSWSGSTAPRPPTAPCWSVGLGSRRPRRWKGRQGLRFSWDTRLMY